MRDREADRLYRRFKEQGDVSALGTLFDHTAPELLRVAAHLVRDLHSAEDLVQETFVAAIRGHETFDRSRSVKPWLFGILVRQAALHHRSRARIADEAADVHASNEAGPSRVASEREWMVELERAVAQLPPLYRDVVERHLRHEQGSQEIAQALERAPGTVRVQIHRGLDLLRKALPAGFAASCGLDAERARGLAAIRESVLAQAASSSAALSTAASGSGGLLAVMAGWKLVASLTVTVALIAVAWIAAARSNASGGNQSVATPPTVDAASSILRDPSIDVDASPRTSVATPTAPDLSGEARPDAAPAPGWILRGRVTSQTSVTLAETEISTRAIGGVFLWPADAVVHAQADSQGRFELDLSPLFVVYPELKPAELVVRADQPDCVPSEIRIDVPVVRRDPAPAGQAPWEFDAVLTIVRAASVSGRVVDEQQRPREGVDVALLAAMSSELDHTPIDLVRTTHDGSFRLRTADSGRCLVVAICDGMRPAARFVTVEYGRDGDPIQLEISPGARITGRIEPLGLPIQSGVQLIADRSTRTQPFAVGSHFLLWDGGESFSHCRMQATSAEDGTFVFAGLSPGLHRLMCAGGPSEYVFAQEPIDVEAPAEGVSFASHWSRVVLAVESGGARLTPAEVRLHRLKSKGTTNWMPVDAAGQFAVFLEGGESYRIEARADGHRNSALDIAAAVAGGESLHLVSLPRQSASLTLEIANAQGAVVTRAGVAFSSLDDSEEMMSLRSGARWWPSLLGSWPDFVRDVRVDNGVITLDNLPVGLFEVRIEPDTLFGTLDCPWFHEPLVVDLKAGEALHERVDLVPAGRIRVDLVGADGAPRKCPIALLDSGGTRVPLRFITRLADGSKFSHVWVLGDAGVRAPALSDPALPPGDYTFVLEPREGIKIEHPIRIVGGEITTLDLVLRDE